MYFYHDVAVWGLTNEKDIYYKNQDICKFQRNDKCNKNITKQVSKLKTGIIYLELKNNMDLKRRRFMKRKI